MSDNHSIDDDEALDTEDEFAAPVIHISRFPDQQHLATCFESAEKQPAGPVAYNAALLFFNHELGSALSLWQTALGLPLFHSIVADTAGTLNRLHVLFTNTSGHPENKLCPSLTMWIVHCIETCIRLNHPDAYEALHTAYHDCYEMTTNDDMSMMDPFHDIIESMDINRELTDQERNIHIDATKEIYETWCIPVFDLLEQRAQDALDMAAETAAASPDGTVMIKQLDGTLSADTADAVMTMIKPTHTALATVELQIAHTLAQHEPVYRDLLSVWWKLFAHPNLRIRHQEAWALDAVGRMFAAMWSPDQMRVLCRYLPMEQMVSNVLSYVYEAQRQAPHLTWPQLRTSFMSSTVPTVAGEDNLIDVSVELYTKMGLESEIELLKLSMQDNTATLTRAIPKMRIPTDTLHLH
jgi:hypothetical protein